MASLCPPAQLTILIEAQTVLWFIRSRSICIGMSKTHRYPSGEMRWFQRLYFTVQQPSFISSYEMILTASGHYSLTKRPT